MSMSTREECKKKKSIQLASNALFLFVTQSGLHILQPDVQWMNRFNLPKADCGISHSHLTTNKFASAVNEKRLRKAEAFHQSDPD